MKSEGVKAAEKLDEAFSDVANQLRSMSEDELLAVSLMAKGIEIPESKPKFNASRMFDVFKKFDIKLEGTPEFSPTISFIITLIIQCVFSTKYAKSQEDRLENLAIGNYWLGVLQGLLAGSKEGKKAIKKNLQKAIDRRHTKNRSVKSYAIKYYREHINEFSSKASAARKIAEMVFRNDRTVESWFRNEPSPPKQNR